MQRNVGLLVLVGLAAFAPGCGARLIKAEQRKTPLSTDEKEAVGNALNHALNALQGKDGGSKFTACDALFPDGKPPANPQDATWLACKDYVYVPPAKASLAQARKARVVRGSLASFYQPGGFDAPESAVVHFASGRLQEDPKKEGEGEEKPKVEYDKGFEEDWHNEYKTKEYPEKAEGKMHHPDYTKAEPPAKSSAFVLRTPALSVLVGALLSLLAYC